MPNVHICSIICACQLSVLHKKCLDRPLNHSIPVPIQTGPGLEIKAHHSQLQGTCNRCNLVYFTHLPPRPEVVKVQSVGFCKVTSDYFDCNRHEVNKAELKRRWLECLIMWIFEGWTSSISGNTFSSRFYLSYNTSNLLNFEHIQR